MYRRGMTMRIVRGVLAVVLLVTGLPVLLTGVLLAVAAQHRDPGGGFRAALEPVSAPGPALVVVDVDALVQRDAAIPGLLRGGSRLRLTATTAEGPAFIGLAPPAAVAAYLAGVPHATIDRVRAARGPLPVTVTPVPGPSLQAAPPAALPMWTSRATGAIEWSPGRHLSLVVMNPSGRGTLAADLVAEARPGWLLPAMVNALILGALLSLAGIVALAWPTRRRDIVYVVEPAQLPDLAAHLRATLPPGMTLAPPHQRTSNPDPAPPAENPPATGAKKRGTEKPADTDELAGAEKRGGAENQGGAERPGGAVKPAAADGLPQWPLGSPPGPTPAAGASAAAPPAAPDKPPAKPRKTAPKAAKAAAGKTPAKTTAAKNTRSHDPVPPAHAATDLDAALTARPDHRPATLADAPGAAKPVRAAKAGKAAKPLAVPSDLGGLVIGKAATTAAKGEPPAEAVAGGEREAAGGGQSTGGGGANDGGDAGTGRRKRAVRRAAQEEPSHVPSFGPAAANGLGTTGQGARTGLTLAGPSASRPAGRP